ncbi:MAG: hypothetical protein O6916_06670 [bacterium]|nr:hypothetical protein [bacterium]
MLALSQVNTLILALEEKGVVEIGELEKGRVKVLGAMKRVEKAKGNGQVDQNEQPTNK